MNPDMTICMKCGVPVGKGKNYCWSCGQPTNSEAVMCVSCGAGLVAREPVEEKGNKSAITAGLLGIFLGGFGIHNFYLGFKKKAAAQLLMSIGGLIFIVLYGVLLANSIVLTTSSVLVDDPIVYEGAGTLLLAIACFFVGIALMSASSIWALVEAIMLLCGAKKVDGKGKLLKD
jgi:hypothetical protein